MIHVTAFLLLVFAAYRLTRFLVFDTFIDEPRTYIQNKLEAQEKYFTDKILDLISCSWCTGAWVSAIILAIYLGTPPWDWNHLDLLSWLAVAGGQGLLHALEPEN